MSFVTLPPLAPRRQLPPHPHRWEKLPVYAGWVQCALCGVTARCKACAAQQVGVSGVAYLPTVVCPDHTPQATFLAALEVQQTDIAQWLLTLAGTVPDALWQREGMPLDHAQEATTIEAAGSVIGFVHAATQDDWSLRVFVQGVMVFAADGPSSALVITTYQPGPWVQPLMTVLSLHDALPHAA